MPTLLSNFVGDDIGHAEREMTDNYQVTGCDGHNCTCSKQLFNKK